ncbi:MAG: hypothetical protein M1835_001313 [Candelina submexicana]|nr:MAG: hypothetical protein M1835_001313 [Candelina submexicana]
MSSHTDELCNDLQNALEYLSRGTRGLRIFAPMHANKVAQKSNEIAEIFMDGVLESEISNGQQSPRLPRAIDDQCELNPSGAMSTPKKKQLASSERVSAMVFADHETSSPTAYVGDSFPSQRRSAPKYPPGLGFGPHNDPSTHASRQIPGSSYDENQTSIGIPAAGNESLSRATALAEPVSRYSSKVAIPRLHFPIVPRQPAALRHPVPSRGLSSGEQAAIFGYSEHNRQEKEVTTEPSSKVPEVESAQENLNPGTSTTKISWAKMAAVPSGGPKTINLRPQPSSVTNPVKATSKVVSVTEGPGSSSPIKESQTAQSRVIWLINCPANMALKDVSDGIHEGPLVSICIVDDYDPVRCPGRAACVIFKDAQDALAFYHSNNKMVFTNSRGRYVSDVRFELGLPYAGDENIRSMDAPIFARRRLTFVRSHLFAASNLTKARFERDLVKHCGQADDIELIHLYNSGNATVVFAAVHLARAVKEAFLGYSKQKGPYQDVQVTYSKDPCEHEIRLITIFKE